MGAVHGVHLKYAVMSAMCTAGVWRTSPTDELVSTAQWMPAMLFAYAAAVHALITTLFLLRRGMWIIGKDPITGAVPLWCASLHLVT